MKSLSRILKRLYDSFDSLDCPVYHHRVYGEPETYVVWREDGEVDGPGVWADNHKVEQKIAGYVDLFTKKEFDPLADDVQDILDSGELSWTLNSIDYEEETGFVHYVWSWEVS